MQIAAGLQQGAYAGVTDLRDVLSQVEELLPNMSEIHRRTFLALYVLFNKLAVPEMRMAGLENVLSRYQSEIERPSVETMLSHLLLGIEPEWSLPEWSLEEHQTIHDAYLRDQGKRDCLRMPPAFKAGLSLALAERYRLDGNTERARDLISAAVENNPGNTALCQMEQSFDTRQAIPWRIGVPLLRPAQGSVTDRLSAGRAIFASDVSGHG